MFMTKLLHMSNAYDQTINCQPWTPSKHEKEDDKSSSVDISMFDTENDKSSSDLDDCCHHIENVSKSIKMFSIFITSPMITN
jgi:hypothetical protein